MQRSAATMYSSIDTKFIDRAHDAKVELPFRTSRANSPTPVDKWSKRKTLAFIVVYCGAAWALIGFAAWKFLAG